MIYRKLRQKAFVMINAGITHPNERKVCDRQADLLGLEVLRDSDREVLEGWQARRHELRRVWAVVDHIP